MKPQIVIFSSSSALPIAEGLHTQLKAKFACDLWKGDFFGENKTTPLWTFFKKLFQYDYVILILSDDNIIRPARGKGAGLWVPKDNVIFELGACMARLGPQKTIMITPDKPAIHLPSYFDHIEPVKYHYTNNTPGTEEEGVAATKFAAESIIALLGSLTPQSFHAELPATGLAFAYQFNFLQPVLSSTKTQDFTLNGIPYHWAPEDGVHITIAIPDEIMNRDTVGAFMAANYPDRISKAGFAANDGRDLGVYLINPKTAGGALQIIDIPTTLLTTRNVVSRVEEFWRDKEGLEEQQPDLEFIKALEAREILNFERAMADIKQQFGDRVSIIPLNQVGSFLMSF